MIIKDNPYPLISIIMNCFNGEKYLSQSIQSIIDQSYKNWELIFWDNLSNDSSKAILGEFSDCRIKYFKSKKFLTLYQARNEALEKAKGDYVTFLDTDDIWVADKLQIQLNFVKKNQEFFVVYSNYYNLEVNSNHKHIKKYHTELPSGFITQKLLDDYKIGLLTVFINKKIFEEYKFNKAYNIIGDFDFFISLSMRFKIGSINKPLAYYRIHQNNFSFVNKKEYINELLNWIKNKEKVMLDNGFSLNKIKTLLFKLKFKFLLSKFFKLNLR